MEAINIEVNETDLGEFIVQICDEPPYHIVTPAMHKTKEDIANIFHEKFNTPKDSSAEDITAFARKKLIDIFVNQEDYVKKDFSYRERNPNLFGK